MLKIYEATTQEHIDFTKVLMLEYLEFLRNNFREFLGILWFIEYYKAFEKEIEGLPGNYSEPDGCILLVEYNGQSIGCVALDKHCEGICEMKRLYIKPEFHRRGIGTVLCRALMDKAITLRYTHMRLGTALDIAKQLYKSLGFTEIAPFDHVPVDGVVYMELKLV